MRARFVTALLAMTLVFGGVLAAPASASTTCGGNFFTRLYFVVFQPSYAAHIWNRCS